MLTRTLWICLTSACLLLILPSSSPGTTYPWVPVATRIERSDLIVIGRVIADVQNRHKDRQEGCGPNEATLLVAEVVRGKLESPRTTKMPDGSMARTILLRHWDAVSTEGGNFSSIPKNERLKNEVNGIWLVQRSNAAGTYCISHPDPLRLAELESVRKTIELLESNYKGQQPGFPTDDRTWVSSWGGVESFTHASVCVQDDGAVFVSGVFRGELAVSGHPVLKSSDWEHFLARLGSDGGTRWVRALGSGQRFDAKPITGPGRSCLLVGDMSQQCTVLGKQMPWAGGRSVTTVCVSPDGNVEWSKSITSGQFATPDPRLFRSAPSGPEGFISSYAAVPRQDGCLIVGSFSGEVVCDKQRLIASTNSEWFVALIGSNGVKSFKPMHRSRREDVKCVAIGRDGRLIIGGWLAVPNRRLDAFVTAVEADGKELWTATEGGLQDDGVIDVVVDSRGTAIATMQILREGYPSQQIVMVAWNSNGDRLWRVDGGGSDIEIGADGNIYCIGSYGQTFMVPQKSMPPTVGDTDLFLACYDRFGKRLWVIRDGGVGQEIATSLHLLPSRVVLAGLFDGATYLAGQVERARGRMDAFVMNIPLPTKPR